MLSLSTLEDYQSITRKLAFPKGVFIDSKFISARGGDEFESVNPAYGQVMTSITSRGQAEVDHAALQTREALKMGDGQEWVPRTANRCWSGC